VPAQSKFGLKVKRITDYCCSFVSWINPNVAKVEDAADPRRRRWSRSNLLRTFGNTGDAASSAFPLGK
jgi:hypothetical protein